VTIVLVTHLMEEAERLCDRIAVIARGRVVAVDNPAALVSRSDAGQRVRFRPSAPLDDGVLAVLPGVTSVTRSGPWVVVTGGSEVVHEVTSVLARSRIVALELRVDQANLDDAFVALTERGGDGGGKP
jgi:ABC-2 type transport system ATP-binding protein